MLEAPSRVWCTIGICDGKSLEEYFLLIPESHNFSEVAKQEVYANS
jgi:hypothetical protein